MRAAQLQGDLRHVFKHRKSSILLIVRSAVMGEEAEAIATHSDEVQFHFSIVHYVARPV
jgi:hypothetical protein